MKIRFLGGASKVSGLAMLMQVKGAKILFDYGFAPTAPPTYPPKAPSVDLCFLSHCHIDHSGMVPLLVSEYDVPVIGTSITRTLSELLAKDSIKVAEKEGYPIPYSAHAIKLAVRNFEPVEFNHTIEIGGMEIKFHSAGHVPGATMFELQGERTTLFTGDLNTINTELMWGAHPVPCDTLFLEATYGGREHPPRDKVQGDFLAKVKEVVDRGGVALVPAFAVGRTQEILLVLKDKGYETWVDGMGKTVNKFLLEEPKYLRSAKRLKEALRETKVVHSSIGRKHALRGDVIVTTSGMLDGGPVLEYLKQIKDDRKSCILLTGYQVENTNGRNLLENRMVDFYGVKEKVKCEVLQFDFSAHAGQKELIEFVQECSPEKIVLCHSDNRKPLADALSEYTVYMPKEGEEIEV